MDRLITLIGGSGFLGRYAVQELAKTRARLRVAVRDPQTALFLKPLGDLGQIQLIAADVRSAASMARACDGADAVVNLVGILDERAQKFEAVQATGAGNVARAAAAAGATRFVQLSAIGADPAGTGYAGSKGRGEAAVLAAFPSATILRPSVVFGPEDDFINRFAGLAKAIPFAVPVIAPETRFQPVYVQDVARAIVAALALPGGGVFELGGPRTWSLREINAYILAQTYTTKPLIDVPDAVGSLLASLQFLPFAPLTKDQWRMLQSDNVVTGTDGLATLGIEPTPLEAIAPGYLVRYRKHGRFAAAR